jgi:hypothetical protein
MGRACTRLSGLSRIFTEAVPERQPEGAMSDAGYIGLTIIVFAALYLILKGVERFER